MKINFPYAFNKRLCTPFLSLMCTLFAFFMVISHANAQCPSGVTISMSYTVDNSTGIPIPLCTPFKVTTTVKNTTAAQKTIDFIRTAYEPGTFEIACLDDYANATACNIPNSTQNSLCINNIAIPAGGERQFSITFKYGTQTLFVGQHAISTNIGDVLNQCIATAIIPLYTAGGTDILGVPGQPTTYNALPNTVGQPFRNLLIRGSVVLNFDCTLNVNSQQYNAIAMDKDATLIIPYGKTLSLFGTNVQGCATMWHSIIVDSGGTLTTTSGANGIRTRIRDGLQAIEARSGSNINIAYTNFEDNVRGFYVPPTTGALQSINFGNAFQACTFSGTGTLRPNPYSAVCSGRVNGFPFAGMDINDLGSLITVNRSGANLVRPVFRNMSNGIIAKRTRLFVNQARFENLNKIYSGYDGLGIWIRDPNSLLLVAGDPNPSSTDLDFSNCTQGIVYENFGLNNLAQINTLRIDNTADPVGVGIRAVNCNLNKSYIYANNIKAKTGIISGWNRFNAVSVGEIYSNTIEPTDPSNPSSSLGTVSYDNAITGNWNIYENYINVQNAQGGMQFNSGTGAIVINNIVDLQPASSSNANGIQAGGSTNFSVSCNTISYFGNPNPFYRSAMYVSSGTGSSYTCNNTGGTEFGLNIVGQSQPLAMSGNNFNRHYEGLRLNNGTVIGAQSFNGNRWNGPFTTFGAVHLDPNQTNVKLSQFVVGSPNAPIMPTFNASAPDWFKFISGIDVTCASSNACSVATSLNRVVANGTNDESFYTSAISGEQMQTPNAEEMKWTAQRNAYGRLMDNPSHQNNRDKTNFVARMRTGSSGRLYEVEKGIKDAQNIGQEFGDVLKANTNSIKTLANEMADLDVKIFAAKGAEKTALMAQKKEKNTTIYRLSTENAPHHATIERKRNQEIQRLMRDNERISARLQPEINEKEVNAIYLATVAQGKMELSNEQKATVKVIAFQCPSKGGNAVFAARSLYSLVENVKFDDLALCNARSESVQGLVVKRVETNYKISPNPATDMLSVSQSSDKAESGEWLIFDTAGKLLLSKKVTENEMQANLNIQGLPEGIYFVSFSVNGEKRFNQKFIKIKSN